MEGIKRKEFYVSTEIWDKDLSCIAKTVLTYLGFCSNRKGECFPSVAKIAEECGVCKNSVRKAIGELSEKGLLSVSARFKPGRYGIRNTSNLYELKYVREERRPLTKTTGGEKPEKAEEKPPEMSEDERGETELKRLLDRLNISGLYEDKTEARAIELAISELWYSESFRFKGSSIPRSGVRSRLKQLDIDAIDSVMSTLEKSAIDCDATSFLKACIYNAPLAVSAETAAFLAGERYETRMFMQKHDALKNAQK